jgi:hypothetical protein
MDMMRSRVPELDKVKPDTPLRLDIAATLAYPDGSMSASGLRKEAGRGRLAIERVAGKDYTTLANIERMRELCRVEAKDRASGYNRQGEAQMVGSSSEPSGSSGTATSSAALEQAKAKLKRLKKPCANTSTKKPPLASATVTPLPSRSPT